MYDPGMRGWDAGYWTAGRLWGIPIRLHWSIPVGALVLGGLQFSPFQFFPLICLGIFFLIFVHELGHAAVVSACGQPIERIDIHGLGGECAWSGGVSPLQRAAIAWGGVWAQMGLLVIASLLYLITDGPQGTVSAQMYHVFIQTNLFIMALNLIPFPPFDGAEAWPLIRILRDRHRRRRLEKQAVEEVRQAKMHIDQDVSEEIRRLDALEDDGDEQTAQQANDLLARITEDIQKDRKNRS